MKGPLDRTKVVLRHLPHTISQSVLMGQIDDRFSGRYNWFCFRSGKQSLKCQSYSRAYIDFKQAEDVIEFAEFFDGHVFVNEKGTQYKTIVEYAPSQRVPKRRSTKDGREGTIGKDPEYLEFLEIVSKPIENLPSAEIQLERKEAERAGAAKETPIVTALMDFVRQRRAAKGGLGRSLPNGKLVRRNAASSSSSSSATVVKRGSGKRATSTMYISRDSGKSTIGKEKSTYAKRDDLQVSEKSSAASGSVVPQEEKGTIGVSETGKKKILLLEGKEKEIPHVTTGVTPQQNSSSIKLAYDSGTGRQNRRHEATGRIIRSILLKKDAHQFQSSAVQLEKNQTLNQDKNRKPPRPQNVLSLSNGLPDDKIHGHDAHGFYSEKLDKRSRTKDKTDRGVWTPLRRSDGAHASDESMSSSTSQSTKVLPDSAEGSHKHSGRRVSSHSAKDADGSSNGNERKPSKRGVSVVSASHEKRLWVQKPSSGS